MEPRPPSQSSARCVRFVSWLVAATACMLLAGRPAGAVPPRPLAREDWLISIWQTEQGLPQNAITALLQSRRGYLWIGTYNGLARFDGVRFTVFSAGQTPELSSGRITSLYEDDGETLWVGQETGGLARWQGGQWSRVTLPPTWPGGSIGDLAADASGALWLLHPSGLLLRLKDGLVIPAPGPGDSDTTVSFTRDAQGGLWVLRDQQLAQLRGETLLPWNAPGFPAGEPVRRVAARRGGGLWLVLGQSVHEWRDGALGPALGTGEWPADDSPLSLQETLTGEVVVGMMRSGLHWFSRNAPPWTLGWKSGLANDWVKVMTADREGNLWVGTAGGLNRLRTRRATMLQAPDRWQGMPLRAVSAGPADELWIGTEGAGLYRVAGDRFESFGKAQGVPNSYLWSVLADRQGRIWTGSWGYGLMQHTGSGFTVAQGWRAEAKIVTALHETRDGAMWVGTERGLARLFEGEWTWFTHAGTEPLRQVRTICEDTAGRVWFGMSGGGLAWIEDGKVTVLRRKDGLSNDFIWALAPEPDDTLWIGTFGSGLCRWKDGRFASVTTRQGLPGDIICHLADDGLGRFWISSFNGIFRVSKAELNLCADGLAKTVSCLALSTSDGLATVECSGGFQPSGARTSDGRLWFPTSRGLAVIDPARIEPHTVPPPVLIENALTDDKPDAGFATGRLEVPPGRHRVEIRYTGLSFTAPEKVRFRHRLTRFDADWIDAGTLRSATYNYLPAGRYQFEVLACNDDGVWSRQPAVLGITVLPLFWHTWWFRAAAVLFCLLVVAGVWRWRRRQLSEMQRLRLRVARDLHDEVGGNLSSIARLSQMFEDQPSAADAGELRRIAVRTVEMLKESVWLTNPAHDRLSELVVHLRETSRQMLGGVAHEFVADDLPGDLVLPAAWRHHLQPILKEALHNAVRHARPASVLITLRMERRRLDLRVQDDGRGFDPQRVVPGGGLLNQHRRARDMGGELRINSKPGEGTSVHLSVRLG